MTLTYLVHPRDDRFEAHQEADGRWRLTFVGLVYLGMACSRADALWSLVRFRRVWQNNTLELELSGSTKDQHHD